MSLAFEQSGAAVDSRPKITVSGLTMAYGESVVMEDLNFTVNERDIFIIMGGSGSGKSTLLRHLVGLQEPARGRSSTRAPAPASGRCRRPNASVSCDVSESSTRAARFGAR